MRNRGSRLATLSLATCCAAPASAAIIPSWRINPINQDAITNSGGLLQNALSISLMVELTGGSMFNVAALGIDGLFNFGSGQPAQWRYYQRVTGGSNVDFPDPSEFATTPALEFDTYVCTAASVSGDAPAAVPGRLNGTGGAQIGNV